MTLFTIIGVVVVVLICGGLVFYLGIPALCFALVVSILFFALKGCLLSMDFLIPYTYLLTL